MNRYKVFDLSDKAQETFARLDRLWTFSELINRLKQKVFKIIENAKFFK
jgi:hypothetical protein